MNLERLSQIKSVGIELEGGYCDDCVFPIIEKYRRLLHIDIDDDGSVSVKIFCPIHKIRNDEIGDYDDNTNGKEILAWTTKDKLPLLFEFVNKLFKSGGFRQNYTCGNHVNVKFKGKRKDTIVETFRLEQTWEEFKKGYLSTFKDKKYLTRLYNFYCKSKWKSSLRSSGSFYNEYLNDYDNRYGMINLRSLFEEQETLEFTILPRFKDGHEAKYSMLKLLSIVNRQMSK